MATYIGTRIAGLRKMQDMTQEQLADKFGISYQAVSKWENGITYPDITLLAGLADTFGVSIDSLLRENEDRAAETADLNHDQSVPALPWPDDRTVRAVAFEGHRLLAVGDQRTVSIRLDVEGDLGDVQCHYNLNCRTIHGKATSGANITCNDVQGDISAGGMVTCDHVDGDVNAGGNITCDNVHGDARAGMSITCDVIEGDASAMTITGAVN